eukprot:836999-Rhodomonas_salina.2
MCLRSGAVKRAHLTNVKGSVTLNDSAPKCRIRSCYLSDVKGTISVCTDSKSGGVKVKEWVAAIKREMEGLHEKGVFTKVRRVPGMHTIPTRFVFKIKTDQYGNVTKYKARLVAKGFVQQKGTDFTESYALTSSAVAI